MYKHCIVNPTVMGWPALLHRLATSQNVLNYIQAGGDLTKNTTLCITMSTKQDLTWQTRWKGSKYNDEAYPSHILNNITILNLSIWHMPLFKISVILFEYVSWLYWGMSAMRCRQNFIYSSCPKFAFANWTSGQSCWKCQTELFFWYHTEVWLSSIHVISVWVVKLIILSAICNIQYIYEAKWSIWMDDHPKCNCGKWIICLLDLLITGSEISRYTIRKQTD